MKKVLGLMCIIALGALASCGAKEVVNVTGETVKTTLDARDEVEATADTGEEAANIAGDEVEATADAGEAVLDEEQDAVSNAAKNVDAMIQTDEEKMEK